MHSQKSALPYAFTPPHTLCGMPQDTPILVGFSGGADSTALLHMLYRHSKCTGAPIYALHINHGIRGSEAERDEQFCREFAKTLGITFFAEHIDIPTLAKEVGESVETAARNERYRIFSKYMTEKSIPILTTAHNADDNLETILFNLARGTGLGGLCGIPRVRRCDGGNVVRPILGLEKSEILAYCEENSLSFVTDSTNFETEYARNKIRNRIIPVLRELNDGAVKNAYRTSEALIADEACLQSLATWFCEELGENCEIDTEKLVGSPWAVVCRVLQSLYEDLCAGTLESTHISALVRLAKKNVPHSRVSLPRGIVGVIEGGRLMLVHESECPRKSDVEEYSVRLLDGKNRISQINCEIFIKRTQSAKNIYKTATLLSLDFATIKGELVARSKKAGDKIRIGGMSKSIKKLMNERGVPLELRSRLPIICDGDEVIAVPYLGVCDRARVRHEHTDALELQIYLH